MARDFRWNRASLLGALHSDRRSVLPEARRTMPNTKAVTRTRQREASTRRSSTASATPAFLPEHRQQALRGHHPSRIPSIRPQATRSTSRQAAAQDCSVLPERVADRYFALPRRGADEQQICERSCTRSAARCRPRQEDNERSSHAADDCSLTGSTRTVHPAFEAGNCRAMSAAIDARSASAECGHDPVAQTPDERESSCRPVAALFRRQLTRLHTSGNGA